MKGYLQQLVRETPPQHGRNVVREYLQARILQELMRAGAMSLLAFMGGTALRFLYYMQRYSEDMDFSLEGAARQYDLSGWANAVTRQFQREAYGAEQAVRRQGAVHKVLLRFPGVLYETGLSPHRSETLMIKLEIDTNPPAGAITESTRVNRHVTLRLHHHDRASLLAGKLLAVLNRQWAKGRDFYDLAWYLGRRDWPEPNLDMLNNGIAQHTPNAAHLTQDTWRAHVAERVAEVPWNSVAADIARFVEDHEDTLHQDELLALLQPPGYPFHR